jgi:hypothetical protein
MLGHGVGVLGDLVNLIKTGSGIIELLLRIMFVKILIGAG